MTALEWGVQLLLVLLLLAAMPFALRLERQLRALRRDRAALEGTAAGLGEATRLAEAASLRLRASAEGAGRQVAEKLAVAEPLRDDLRYLVERAEGIADRLDGLVREARGIASAPAAGRFAAHGAAHLAVAPADAPPLRGGTTPGSAGLDTARPGAVAATGRSRAERELLRSLLGEAAAPGQRMARGAA